MKIGDPNASIQRASQSPVNPATVQRGRTASSTSKVPDAAAGSGGGMGETDQISLSNLSVRLRELVSSASSTQKVDQIAKQYQAGTYRPNPAATSKAIVRDAAFGGF